MQHLGAARFAAGRRDFRGEMEQWFAPWGDRGHSPTAELQEEVPAQHLEQLGPGRDPGDARCCKRHAPPPGTLDSEAITHRGRVIFGMRLAPRPGTAGQGHRASSESPSAQCLIGRRWVVSFTVVHVDRAQG